MRLGGPFTLVSLAAVMAAACQPQRIEHHMRPAFYEKAALGELPSEVTLEDGTIIKYHSNQAQSTYGRGGDDRYAPLQIREETQTPDGKVIVTLRALMPEHVLTNALTCVQREEYELMWEQLIAQRTKEAYEEAEQGFEEFAEVFRKHRHDFAATLTRMVSGLPAQEVSMKPIGGGITRCKLRPQIADPFKFKVVDVVKEDQQFKLLMIRAQ